ncbi:uncharacterized protein LOC114365508 [Ostrinia furnacalis]|uniref:uncharacterized protein LOC114365508 n=1 Tax=Ostrinia furnacalis TaxID=93504 RepID=UPI00103E6AF0|nr:uncharacterized protein LOC114365508 [Ostrinia furnacalis]
MEEASDDDNRSDSEIINECEREIEAMLEWDNSGIEYNTRNVEKRGREESEENSEEGFVTVTSRKAKRLLRSNSLILQTNGSCNISNREEAPEMENTFQICITSLTALPKQFALAKLMKKENIDGINQIKYKSPYKVLVQFDTKECADKLLGCSKMVDYGYRCQSTTENNISYGVIKGVDLDIDTEEIKKSLESPYEITSIIRLKRLDLDGKWIDSESIRISFKGSTLPSYVHAYGCRFKVESYEFPVTQCSLCWRFGHIAKFCPTKKVFCPKCGKDHDNCETEIYQCLNCKGPHMALDKKCPMFIKEKEIRKIMCQQNSTYRKALQLYLQNQTAKEKASCITNVNSNASLTTKNKRSYSSVLITQAQVHEEKLHSDSTLDNIEEETQVLNSHGRAERNKKKYLKKKKNDFVQGEILRNEEVQCIEEVKKAKRSEQNKQKFEFKKFLLKVKSIIVNDSTFEDKISSFVKLIVEEIKNYIISFVSKGEAIDVLFKNFFDG